MTEESRAASRSNFGLRKAFFWMTIASLPLAFFGQYYYWANNTVDQRTKPLLQSGIALGYFILFLGVVLLLCLVPLRRLLTSGRYRAASALVILLGLIVTLIYPIFESRVLHPPVGNAQAVLHNDAAAVTAAALLGYFDRNEQWPGNWQDLRVDVEQVLSEVESMNRQRALKPAGPPVTPAPGGPGVVSTSVTFASAPTVEPDQSLLARNVDTTNLDFDKLQKLVDVDFKAQPSQLVRMPWHECNAIRAHKPSYNTYRVEYQMLLDRMKRWAEAEGYLFIPK